MKIEKINEIIKDNISNRQSFFQIENFLINKEPTHQAKLRQCIMEMQSRKKILENVSFEVEETKDKIALIEMEEIKFTKNEEKIIKTRMKDRQVRYLKNKVKELEEVEKATLDELYFIYQMYTFLLTKEPQKEWESPEVQLEYYNEKLLKEVKTKFLLGLPIDGELLNTIMALPDKAKVKMELISYGEKRMAAEESRLKKINNNNVN